MLDDPPGDLLTAGAVVAGPRRMKVWDPWLLRATDFCWAALDGIDTPHPYKAMSALAFLDAAPDRNAPPPPRRVPTGSSGNRAHRARSGAGRPTPGQRGLRIRRTPFRPRLRVLTGLAGPPLVPDDEDEDEDGE
nr:hypothetical protein [Streptantibioticus silvisoli]